MGCYRYRYLVVRFFVLQAVAKLRAEVPHLDQFSTLSPIPGFRQCSVACSMCSIQCCRSGSGRIRNFLAVLWIRIWSDPELFGQVGSGYGDNVLEIVVDQERAIPKFRSYLPAVSCRIRILHVAEFYDKYGEVPPALLDGAAAARFN